MKKLILSVVILAAMFVGSIYYMTTLLTEQIDIETKVYKDKVGEKIVLNKDTLTIIDYSMLNSNFTLENGTEISKELVDKLLRGDE